MHSGQNWFNESRYGMFIHWGAYSVAGRGEWIINREQISLAEYTQKYVNHFKAEKYDPVKWVELAKAAGMKYMVLTTRHHDGFALWETQTTTFNSIEMGPRKDLVKPFVEAVRDGGMKVGLYYSGADWMHPDYPDAYSRDWPTAWRDKQSQTRFEAYYKEQIRELMSNYGKIDILWYDGCLPKFSNGAEVNEMVKELQPGIWINARNGPPFDFVNSEQTIIPPDEDIPWEACMTLNKHWGYCRDDHDFKSPKDVIDMLLQTSKSGGNLLLNVGPKADGTIPEQSANILLEAGAWLEKNGEFLAYSTKSPFTWNLYGHYTTKGNTVYVHILYSTGEELCIAEIKNKILDVYFVETREKVLWELSGSRLYLRNLPVEIQDKLCLTIAIEVEGTPVPIREQTSFWIPGYEV